MFKHMHKYYHLKKYISNIWGGWGGINFIMNMLLFFQLFAVKKKGGKNNPCKKCETSNRTENASKSEFKAKSKVRKAVKSVKTLRQKDRSRQIDELSMAII